MTTYEYKTSHPLGWTVIGVLLLAGVVAVAATRDWLPVSGEQQAAVTCADCGVIESVRTVEIPTIPAEQPAAIGDATLADATAAPATTILTSYEITVRYQDGSVGVFNQEDPPAWQAGDKVRVIDGAHIVAG